MNGGVYMLKRFQGFVAGFLVCFMLTGVVFAKTGSETIEALYNNIKIYVDGIKIDPKDANGNSVEPFIYNGTTYLPVRAVGEAIGKSVSWDGATQSVYLGVKPGDVQYLIDVCPPFEVSDWYIEYSQNNGDYFNMAGKKYSNGFTLGSGNRFAIFNLDNKYSSIDMTIGRLDGSKMIDMTVSFFLDQKLIKTVDVSSEAMPQTISIPVEHGLQLKILVTNNQGGGSGLGFGNVTIK